MRRRIFFIADFKSSHRTKWFPTDWFGYATALRVKRSRAARLKRTISSGYYRMCIKHDAYRLAQQVQQNRDTLIVTHRFKPTTAGRKKSIDDPDCRASNKRHGLAMENPSTLPVLTQSLDGSILKGYRTVCAAQ